MGEVRLEALLGKDRAEGELGDKDISRIIERREEQRVAARFRQALFMRDAAEFREARRRAAMRGERPIGPSPLSQVYTAPVVKPSELTLDVTIIEMANASTPQAASELSPTQSANSMSFGPLCKSIGGCPSTAPSRPPPVKSATKGLSKFKPLRQVQCNPHPWSPVGVRHSMAKDSSGRLPSVCSRAIRPRRRSREWGSPTVRTSEIKRIPRDRGDSGAHALPTF